MSASTSSAAWPPVQVPGLDRVTLRLGRESVDEPCVADWDLKRNCSIAPRQLIGFFVSLCVVSLGIAAVFWMQGARLVMPFACLELLAVGWALWMYARHATDRESIALREDRLTVVHANGSQEERVEFQPAWVRVEPRHDDNSLVELSGQGKRIAVGRYVRPEQRRQLADELRWALRRWSLGGRPSVAM